MSIDWIGYHRVILENLKDGETAFEKIQDNTFLTSGALTSIIGGLMAKKCVFSTRPGYFEITLLGARYLEEISTNTSEKRSIDPNETRRQTE